MSVWRSIVTTRFWGGHGFVHARVRFDHLSALPSAAVETGQNRDPKKIEWSLCSVKKTLQTLYSVTKTLYSVNKTLLDSK